MCFETAIRKKSKRAQSKNWQKKTWIELEENSKFLKHLESCVEFSYHNSRFHGLSWSNRREKTKYPVGKNCWLRVLLKKTQKIRFADNHVENLGASVVIFHYFPQKH